MTGHFVAGTHAWISRRVQEPRIPVSANRDRARVTAHVYGDLVRLGWLAAGGLVERNRWWAQGAHAISNNRGAQRDGAIVALRVRQSG